MRTLRWIAITFLFILTSCSSHHHLRLLGYIEGEYVYLSSPVSGRLIQLAVHRGESVTTNQLAYQLDPQPDLAHLKSAQTDLIYTQKMLARNDELKKTHAVGEATVDLARQQYDSALQKVTEYSWAIAQKTVRIPENGFVQDTLFEENEFVPAGKPVIQFLPPSNRILVFFVPERQLSLIRHGQKIVFTCDHCPKPISATINYISSQAQYTPPVIYSRESREKLVYWVEAKIDPVVVNTTHPGQPVEVTIG